MQIEFPFTLPRGFLDENGFLHQDGVMRLALALDEIEAMEHPRVQENGAYLSIVLLSRVITQLGSLTQITPPVIERLFAADLLYLEDLYLRLNSQENLVVTATCPGCHLHFPLQVAPLMAEE